MNKGNKQSNYQQQKLDVKNVDVKKHTFNKGKQDLQIRLLHYSIRAPTVDLNGIRIDMFLNNSHIYILFYKLFCLISQ